MTFPWPEIALGEHYVVLFEIKEIKKKKKKKSGAV